jgi:hypothetical protein
MAFIDKTATGVALPSDLEIFQKKANDLTIQATYFEKHSPINQYDPLNGDITYEVGADTQDYMKPSGCFLTAWIEVRRADGTPLQATDRVALENNAGHTIFKELHLELGKQAIASETFYPSIAMMNAVTNFSSEANKSHRTAEIFYKDTAREGVIDVLPSTDVEINAAAEQFATDYLAAPANAGVLVNPGGGPLAPANQAALNDYATLVNAYQRQESMRCARALISGRERALAGLNKGLQKRMQIIAGSQRVWMRIYLESEFFKIDKYIPNGVEMKLKLVRSKPEYCLRAHQAAANPQKYRVLIHEPLLWIQKSKVIPEVYAGQNEEIYKQPATYFVNRQVVRPFTIPIGTTSYALENVTTGQIPKRLIFGFVRSDALDGDYTRSPFNFQHLNLQRAAVYIHGVSYPTIPYAPVYDGNQPTWAREYDGLFTTLGIGHGNRGIEISREDYPNGNCLYAFDLTSNLSSADDSTLKLKKSGNPRLEFQLGEATGYAITCLVFTVYDHYIKIDGDRQVHTSFGL